MAVRRFYETVTVAAEADGFRVLLDGRMIKTPARADLTAPSEAVAQAIAAEWRAQGAQINAEATPMTRFLNTAIDRVAPRRDEVVDEIAGFGATDLLCYRAEEPVELTARQARAWEPLLDWAAEALGARLEVAEGVMPIAQPADALAALKTAVAAHDDLALAGLHRAVNASGSLVIGLALGAGRVDGESGWRAASVDDDWQIEKWGEDEEAAAQRAARRADFTAAARLFALLRG